MTEIYQLFRICFLKIDFSKNLVLEGSTFITELNILNFKMIVENHALTKLIEFELTLKFYNISVHITTLSIRLDIFWNTDIS